MVLPRSIVVDSHTLHILARLTKLPVRLGSNVGLHRKVRVTVVN